MDKKELVNLIEQIKQGIPGAFDRLYEEYKNQAYRTAVFLTGSREDAQDVVQDTFVTVCLEIRKLKNSEAFEGWLYRILTNNAKRVLKKRRWEFPKESTEMQEMLGSGKSQEDFSDALLKQEENQFLRELIDQMGEKYRIVIVLYYFNEFSIGKIAHIIGCREGTVKSRLFKARKLLEKKLLETEGVRS